MIITGSALQCYECNSHNDSRCADALPPESLKRECPKSTNTHDYILCRKITQIIEFEVNGCKSDCSLYLNVEYYSLFHWQYRQIAVWSEAAAGTTLATRTNVTIGRDSVDDRKCAPASQTSVTAPLRPCPQRSFLLH